MLTHWNYEQAVGADLEVMDRDAKKMRQDGPTVFSAVKHGKGIPEIIEHITHAHHHAMGIEHGH